MLYKTVGLNIIQIMLGDKTMICVYAVCHVKPECVEEFLKVTAVLVEETRKEEGNISYLLAREIGEENVFTFIEQWKDDDTLDLHVKLPHFTQAVSKFGSLLASPIDIHKLKTV